MYRIYDELILPIPTPLHHLLSPDKFDDEHSASVHSSATRNINNINKSNINNDNSNINNINSLINSDFNTNDALSNGNAGTPKTSNGMDENNIIDKGSSKRGRADQDDSSRHEMGGLDGRSGRGEGGEKEDEKSEGEKSHIKEECSSSSKKDGVGDGRVLREKEKALYSLFNFKTASKQQA